MEMRPQNYQKWGQATERLGSPVEGAHLPPGITVTRAVRWADPLPGGLSKSLSLNLFGTVENAPSQPRQMSSDNIKHLGSPSPPGGPHAAAFDLCPTTLQFLG